jgi:hypothetical protein
MASPKGHLEVFAVAGATWVFCAVCLGVTFLFLKQVGARFGRRKWVESGVFTDGSSSATGFSRRWAYGKRIGIGYTSDFSHLTRDQYRRCQNAMKICTVLMAISMSGAVTYLFIREYQ